MRLGAKLSWTKVVESHNVFKDGCEELEHGDIGVCDAANYLKKWFESMQKQCDAQCYTYI